MSSKLLKALLGTVLVLSLNAQASVPCRSDSECSRNEVCSQGKCVPKGDVPAPPTLILLGLGVVALIGVQQLRRK